MEKSLSGPGLNLKKCINLIPITGKIPKKANRQDVKNYEKNPIGLCQIRSNLVVNEEYCLICNRTFFPYPCKKCGGQLKRKGVIAVCEKCNQFYSKNELKKLKEMSIPSIVWKIEYIKLSDYEVEK